MDTAGWRWGSGDAVPRSEEPSPSRDRAQARRISCVLLVPRRQLRRGPQPGRPLLRPPAGARAQSRTPWGPPQAALSAPECISFLSDEHTPEIHHPPEQAGRWFQCIPGAGQPSALSIPERPCPPKRNPTSMSGHLPQPPPRTLLSVSEDPPILGASDDRSLT